MKTVTLPESLYPSGFMNPGQASWTEQPVSRSKDIEDARYFIADHFRKSIVINHGRTSGHLLQLYRDFTGRIITPGEIIAAFLLEGFKYERIGSQAAFAIDEDSVRSVEDKSTFSLTCKVAKGANWNNLVKKINQFQLHTRASIIEGLLKGCPIPKPYAHSFLHNRADGLCIRFMTDHKGKIIEAESFGYEDGLKMMLFSEPNTDPV